MLRSARIAAGLSFADLEPVAGPRGSLRQIEAGKWPTRSSRLRPWLLRLGVDPNPILEAYADVIAPERADGKQIWRPIDRRSPRKLPDPPELTDSELAGLGADLWRIRDRAGLSRPQLAVLIGCSRVHVWLVEHGTKRPSIQLLGTWLALAPVSDRLAVADRFPALIATLVPRAGAPRSKPSPTHGRAAAARHPKESR